MTAKKAKESTTIMTNIVLTNETNYFHNMFGGDLLARMDRASAISAMRHCESDVVTAAVNNVSFRKPIPLGSVLEVVANVTRSFGTSLEVAVDVWIDDPILKEKTKANIGFYTFVALDKNQKPHPVPELIPETDIEKQRFEDALMRREISLIYSGRINPGESSQLKKYFQEKNINLND